MAKNKSPGLACRESVQTFFTTVSAAPGDNSARHAPATNFKERASTDYFNQ
jgi:hypothetical protein